MDNSKAPKALWILAIGMAINVTGHSFLWPLNMIYITEVLGKSAAIAGTVLMFQQAFGILGSLIGGRLFDIKGGKRTVVIGTSFSIIAVFLLIFFRDWYVYLFLLFFLGFANGLVFPSMYATAGTIWPKGGRKAFNMIYVSQNLGVALGASLGGVFAQISFKLVFLANSITFLIFLLIILFGIKKEDWRKADIMKDNEESSEKGVFVKEKIKTPKINSFNFVALLILAFSMVLTWTPYVQWQTSLSLYIKSLGIEMSKYTLLWTINGALIVLGQPIISFITRKYITTLKKQMTYGVVIFAIAFLVLINNTEYSIFVLAMVIMTFAEMLVWPAAPAAAAELAPDNKKGLYQGVISSSGAGGRMFGFLIGGWLYEYTTINNILILMIGLFFVAEIGFIFYDKVLKFNNTEESISTDIY